MNALLTLCLTACLWSAVAGAQDQDRDQPPPPPAAMQEIPGIEVQEKLPEQQRASVSYQQLRQQADELAQLSGSLPADVEQLNKGIFFRKLNDKLRRIEKLSKKLRREISR